VVRRGQFTPVIRDRFCAQEFGLTLSAALVEVIEVRPRMPIVSKQQLALSLGMATATIDRWIARHPDFPVVTAGQGGAHVVAWQFDVEAVRGCLAGKRAEQLLARDARQAAIHAIARG
jgi:predicted DNA-binding transcriptional regulator AlpA